MATGQNGRTLTLPTRDLGTRFGCTVLALLVCNAMLLMMIFWIQIHLPWLFPCFFQSFTISYFEVCYFELPGIWDFYFPCNFEKVGFKCTSSPHNKNQGWTDNFRFQTSNFNLEQAYDCGAITPKTLKHVKQYMFTHTYNQISLNTSR